MATTTDAAPVAPLAEQEEEPKKVEPAAEEEEEEPKKVEAGGDGEGKDEEVRFEGKYGGVGSPEAEADGGGADGREVEAAEGDAKSGSLGAAEAEEDRELAAEVAEAAASAVAETPAAEVESVNDELGEGDASPASPDAPAGGEMGEFEEEEKKPEEAGVVAEVKDEGKVADDAEYAVPVEKETEGTKVEEMGSGDGGGGELGSGKEEEEVAASARGMEAAELEDKVAPAAVTNGKLVGEVEAVVVGGEEAREESPEKEANVEDEAAKPETLNEESPEVCEHAASNSICY